jgi:hypothetical protein
MKTYKRLDGIVNAAGGLCILTRLWKRKANFSPTKKASTRTYQILSLRLSTCTPK